MEQKVIKCKVCGRPTNHYLTAKGEYKCPICHTTNEILPPKATCEVDPEFEEFINNPETQMVITEEGVSYE